tara:strand:+ start:1517 stop:2329 length:813 start_codon:yes stop_codon:yes gene_type:complete
MSDKENSSNEEILIENQKNQWMNEQEDILKIWADKALCYKAMHDRSYKKYWCLNAWFNIPIIILSTLTGTGNFAQNSFNSSYKNLLIILIGAANILSAILGTIATYINVAGTLEGHRFAAISWDKYARGIQVELSKVRIDRVDPKSYVKRCQEDFDRLIEISPDFSTDVIDWFNKLINTGEFTEKNQACGVCFYEWFCLPCGFRGCEKSKCCENPQKKNRKENFKVAWSEIELPEILGRITPTKVVRHVEHVDSLNKYRINSLQDEEIDV